MRNYFTTGKCLCGDIPDALGSKNVKYKNIRMKKYFGNLMLAGLACIMMVSCRKILEKSPTAELDFEKAYQNVYDADAAVMGIYGKFMSLADRYVILNELRADLLSYTDNADKYLRQISSHTVTADNPYASPRPFYELIINCNDVLENLSIMFRDKKISEANYTERYSDIACLRSFLYLQLGIHYGDEVRYVTSPLATIEDAQNESLFPKVSFDELLNKLIAFTEPIPYKDQYSTGSSLNITLDGYPTTKFFINKKCLLGDLYLWKGDYTKAATYYREVMEVATTGTEGENYYTQYKLGWYGTTGSLYVAYGVNGSSPSLAFNTGWRLMFETAMTVDHGIREWVWALPYDNKFAPANPLIKLFSPIGGDYLVKPSQQIMDMWNAQVQLPVSIAGSLNGLPYDARGPLSVSNIGGKNVAMKYLYKYINWQTNSPLNPLTKNGDWYLYRQTNLHMRFAEAANRQGMPKLGYALFNNGIGGTYDSVGSTDITKWMHTLDLPYPFNFDARYKQTAIPFFRGIWYRNIGVRRRANLPNYVMTATTKADSLVQVENGLIEETALENAFEGTRWADLLRVARRRNDPAFIADKVYQKLLKDGDPNAAAARAKLMNKANWYLPFKL